MSVEPPSTGAVSTSLPTVDTADDQALVPVDAARWATLLGRVLAAEGVGAGACASLAFVDEAEIARLNREHLGCDGPTDVLAFPIDGADAVDARPGAGGPPPVVGDVVICPEVAARNAADRGRCVDDEIALLVVHGALHLLGHDHDTATRREAMWARQRELLADLHGTAPEPAPDGGGS